MDNNTLLQVMIALLVGSLIILAGIGVTYALRSISKNATPSVQVVLAALLPWALKAIIAGEMIASDELDELGRELDGIDKAAVAKSLYALLPNSITINGKAYDITYIKHVVTLDMWITFVQQNFDEVKALIVGASAYLKKQIPPVAPLPTFEQSVILDASAKA